MSKALKGSNTYRLRIRGKVQGVGFRPFVYRIANQLGLCGTVSNSHEGALIELNASTRKINSFISLVKSGLPPNSSISSIITSRIDPRQFKSLSILTSRSAEKLTADIPPDIATCGNCLSDIHSEENRRYAYPFTNCTACGPRFSIIRSLPYDRKNTTMKKFKMCPSCAREYNNPADRRFHAQPNACPDCGPQVSLLNNKMKQLAAGNSAVEKTAELIKQGKIIAVKSIGGYHIACDAFNANAINLLRKRKNRPYKPFAVMMPDIEHIRRHCEVNASEVRSLSSPAAPIVLLRTLKTSPLHKSSVNPGNAWLGVMLPYTPLHHLLFKTGVTPRFKALVMTSGNISNEPIITDETAINCKLSGIADSFLINDRPIHNRCDDSIMFNLRGDNNIFIRKSRGFVPEPVILPIRKSSTAIFAAGAELKNTLCFVRARSAYASQFIGDLDNFEASRFYGETYAKYKDFLGVKPGIIAYDLHPDYHSTLFAKMLLASDKSIKAVPVQHHHAHIASVLAEKNITRPVIGLAFDGTGLGADGNVWGSECLLVTGAGYKRLAHLEYFPLPGGDIAAKQIWRLAVSLVKKSSLPGSITNKYPSNDIRMMIAKGVNSPLCSSMGRFFDAVAALIGIRNEVTFEAQAAMEMESIALDITVKKGYNFEVVIDKDNAGSPAVITTGTIIEEILTDIRHKVAPDMISAKFHFTVSEIALRLVKIFSKETGIKDIVLSGGVFQNRVLTRLCIERLEKVGFNVHYNTIVPPNDGGISLGQAFVASRKLNPNIQLTNPK